MVRVEDGMFIIGSIEYSNYRGDLNECLYQVTVCLFSIGKYEVTKADSVSQDNSYF
jgi:hypothetical protein